MLHLRPTSFPQRRLSGRETWAAAGPVVAVCDGGIGAERRQQAPQRLFAFQERRAHQVAAVEIRKVEGLESQTVRGTRAQRLLEQPAARNALLVEHDDLAVDERTVERKSTRLNSSPSCAPHMH